MKTVVATSIEISSSDPERDGVEIKRYKGYAAPGEISNVVRKMGPDIIDGRLKQ